MKSLKTSFILAAMISLSCSSKFKPESYQAAGISVHFEDKVEYIMPYPSWVPNQLGLYNAKKWPKDKREFRIQFVNGDQDIYTETLQDWDKGITSKTGLKFVQVNTQPDMIVSFVQNNQAWSYVGKDLAQIAKQGQPTMNLGWHIKYRNNEGGERYGTGNHEMLHALGYIHTLQSPAAVGNLKWNRDFVYAKYAKLGWNKTMVDANVLSTYSNTIVTDNQWDPRSIMCYPVGPGEANIQVGRNNEFSSIDDMKLVSDYAGVVPPTTGNQFADSLISCFKPSRQSSNYNAPNSYPADKANDCRNQPLHGANFSHTGSEASPWWEVDLGDTFRISQIDVINRMDNATAKNRLKKFKIYTSLFPITNLSPIVVDHTASAPIDSVKFQVQASARYVRLQAEMSPANYLNLSEIRVWGSPAAVICRDSIIRVPYTAFRDSVVQVCN